MTQKQPRTFHVVSHTHWDREWYQSFEVFRLRLVNLMDRLLEIYDVYPDFIFHLDAQTVCLEDYLEFRPQNRMRLQELIESRRIIVGPWYVQNDFYLSRGESTIRNLLVGSEIAGGFGACEPLGYTPDQFGLIGQLPQIYRQFGFEATVFARGYRSYEKNGEGKYVPVERNAEFDWVAPDGSVVHAVYLSGWYNNAQRFSADPDRAYRYLEHVSEVLGSSPTTQHRLLMNGVDHLEAQEDLLPILGQLQSRLGEGESISQSTMLDYANITKELLKGCPKDRVEGELRQGRDREILQGTLSSRRYLKELNTRCQTLLELQLEPLYAMLVRLTGGKVAYPSHEVRYLWKEVMKNQAHDSICGCSTDRVHQDNENRFRRVLDCAGDLVRRGLQEILTRTDREGLDDSEFLLAVVNPLPFPRSEPVMAQLRLPLADQIQGFDLLDVDGQKVAYEVADSICQHRMTLSPFNVPGLIELNEVTIRFMAREIPAGGYSIYRIVPSSDSQTAAVLDPKLPAGIENEFLSVSVSDNGTVAMEDRKSGWKTDNLFSFEDSTDAGDSYCFIPVPDREPFDLSVVKPTVTWVEKTALRQCIRLEYRFALPTGFDQGLNQCSSGRIENRVSVELSLQSGASLLDLSGWVDNASKDHRLRILVHTGIDTDRNLSSQPFDCVERSRYPEQPDLKVDWTHPNNGWISVSDEDVQLSVFTDSMYDYEHLSDARHSLAFTCVRATGRIVDDAFGLTVGKIPPSPEWSSPENQSLRRTPFHLAIRPGRISNAELFREQQCWMTPLLVAFDSVDPHRFMEGESVVQDSDLSEMFYRDVPLDEVVLPHRAEGVSLNGNAVFSAYKRKENHSGYVLRMYNPADETVSVELSGVTSVRKTTLAEISMGEALPVNGVYEQEVLAKRIVTLEID
ncbi:MAG: hypothetical protein DRP64_14685 [Verrucomicrobia bacterium]|nr:MAG: hypothetical protein DRP64_14685 [Verrucomicrobiota bacterium]